MKILNNIQDYLYNLFLFYPESKLFLFLFLIAYLFGLLNKVNVYVSIGQCVLLVFGLKNIKCLIEGNCYNGVYTFLLIFAFTNIFLVLYKEFFFKFFPNTTIDFIKKGDKGEIYYKLSQNVLANTSKIRNNILDKINNKNNE
tara:strand:- start:22 stop:447 length:426 start_codon:yes stop_codon:yes gene_type:complete